MNWRSDFLYEHLFEHPGIPKSVGVVSDRFKYLKYWRKQNTYEELFDLKLDPDEKRNLANIGQYQQLLSKLRTRTNQLIEDVA